MNYLLFQVTPTYYRTLNQLKLLLFFGPKGEMNIYWQFVKKWHFICCELPNRNSFIFNTVWFCFRGQIVIFIAFYVVDVICRLSPLAFIRFSSMIIKAFLGFYKYHPRIFKISLFAFIKMFTSWDKFILLK